MLGGAELLVFSLLHLVAVHGITTESDEHFVKIVNNSDFDADLRNWPEIYRYRGVPNVTSYYVITSPGFPNECCNKSDTALTAVTNGTRQHLFLICTDFDVPDHTHLIFWTGTNSFVPMSERQGRRIRPISWLPRGYLRVDFKPPAVAQRDKYTGFRCMVWETGREVGLDEWLPRPSSECEQVDTSQLKSIKVSVGIHPAKLRIDFYYDCTWQIKVPRFPDSREDWHVYVYINAMDVDGLVEIRKGLHSLAPLMATNRKDPPPNYRGLDSLHQPPEGYFSKQGLFVKLIKPYYHGEFVFTYGTFALQHPASSAHVSDYTVLDTARTCTLHLNATYAMSGFLCNSTQRCIPHTYGSDEVPFCREAFFAEYDALCQAGQRNCRNGVCLAMSERCPEDSCPEDRPHKCDSDSTCFGPQQMCDGVNFCTDGADENCSQHYDFSHIYPILGAICGACALLIILCVAIWFWHRKRLRHGGNADAEGVTNPGSDVPMMDMPRRSIEQEALINDGGTPTPPNGYEDIVNGGADHDSTTSLTRDHN